MVDVSHPTTPHKQCKEATSPLIPHRVRFALVLNHGEQNQMTSMTFPQSETRKRSPARGRNDLDGHETLAPTTLVHPSHPSPISRPRPLQACGARCDNYNFLLLEHCSAISEQPWVGDVVDDASRHYTSWGLTRVFFRPGLGVCFISCYLLKERLPGSSILMS